MPASSDHFAGVVLLSLLLGACHERAPETRTDAGVAQTATLVTLRDGTPLAVRPAERGPAVDLVPREAAASLTAKERVGQSIFFDANLSEPAGTSCASCHDPALAFSGDNGGAAGVAQGSRPGHAARRNAPSLLYLKYVPPFHFALEDDDDVTESPFGGLGWSGRADTIQEFVRLPLFDADEMNGKSEVELFGKLRAAPYAADLAREYPGSLSAPASALQALAGALQAFLTSGAMAPFTSKFDDYLRRKAQLSPLEMKGLAAFEDRTKGACNQCHRMNGHSTRPESSLFTSYSYDAVGVPRNRVLAANDDPKHYDLGLCERKGGGVPSSGAKWCGFFRIPSLRNVALRKRFMHNGAFASLREVVAFYATRGTDPNHWYAHGEEFDDLPARYRDNVNILSFPYNRREGDRPALDDDDIDAIVAFLGTLTDAPMTR
jgi:cytochrome c peroxidase